MESASESYTALVEGLEAVLPRERFDSATDRRKAIRQAARSVLPNATETKIFVTGNVRAWRHFIEMRATPFADWEIAPSPSRYSTCCSVRRRSCSGTSRSPSCRTAHGWRRRSTRRSSRRGDESPSRRRARGGRS